ncbi:pilus assembly protein PilM [Chloroflexota bacterium]
MYLTLNISSKEVKLLALTQKGIQYWSSKEFPSGWINGGHILDPKAVGAVIASLLKSYKISQSNVAICVTGLPFTHRIVKLPRIKQALLRDAIKHFMSKETSMPIEQMCLSWAMIDQNDDEVTFFVVGVDQQIIDAVVETMKEAKIRHWTMDLKPFALARVASLSNKNAIVVAAESDCYDIILLDNGNVSTMHTVSREKETDTAESVKQIVAEISKVISYDAKKHKRPQADQDTPLFLTGAMSGDKDFIDLIEDKAGYPVRLLAMPLALQADLPVHQYSANIGLAINYVSKFDPLSQNASPYSYIEFDILSRRFAKSAKKIPAPYLIIPAILTILIGLAMPIYWANIEHNVEILRLQNELGTVNQRLQEARLNDEKAGQINRQIEAINGYTENLKKGRLQLFGNQGEFALNLEKINDYLPPQSYFTQLNLSPQIITVSGKADDALKAVDYTTILEQEGFSSDIRISDIGDASGGENISDNITFTVIIIK